MFLSFSLFIVILAILFHVSQFQEQKVDDSVKQALFVLAHPDDESMFMVLFE